MPSELGELRWDHGWWTANAQACPWGVALTSWLGLEPCLAAHLGRYTAEIEGVVTSASWLGLVELALRARAGWGRVAASVELGGSVPLEPLGIEREGQVFFRQSPGLVAAVAITYRLAEIEKQ